MEKKLRYLNVGCGSKNSRDWINLDMNSNSSDVISYNVLNGLPFSDEYFEVVYHSQVLEHIPKEKAFYFVKECYRVLKKNGIIRIVVPDLENIVNEYIKYLNQNLKGPSEESQANYDWIMLEMYDQTVRNFSGGQMGEFLKREKMVNENYVLDRTGFVGRSIRKNFLPGTNNSTKRNIKTLSFYEFVQKSMGFLKRKISSILYLNEKYRICNFRLGGEVHMWMYDRYSLSQLLKDVGFTNIIIKNAYESDIPNWNLYELDIKDGLVYDPSSLFMEASK